MTDQGGIPISLGLTGANVHDKHQVEPVLDSVGIRGARGPRRPKKIMMDRGYDYADVDLILRNRKITAHIRRKGEAPFQQSDRSRLVKGFVQENNDRIELESLPAYAPELNPVEFVWGYWKQHAMRNYCAKDFSVSWEARRALSQMRRRTKPVESFWKQADLFDG